MAKAVFLSLYLFIFLHQINADRPCAARHIEDQSVVCVCNATYCDDITRVHPCSGQFVTYTSSAAGSRFKKGKGYLSFKGRSNKLPGEYTIELDVSATYQKIKGFGGAVTDSAGINWKSLPKMAQKHFIESYFSKTGLEYNMVRVPIGGCDFSVRHYTYDDGPSDPDLSSFSLQKEDHEYKIPMLKKIFEVATSPVLVVTSYWSPPEWMKYRTPTNTHCGFLKEKHYQTFAKYLLKFIESYEKQGVPVWAITTGNEPTTAYYATRLISCLRWDHYNQANWIVNNLGPTIRNSKYRDVKILALDDQLYTIPLVFDDMVQNNTKLLDFVDGLAVHYYTDSYVNPNLASQATKDYPNLFVISTEACEGFKEPNKSVLIGSWERAQSYIEDIIKDLNNDQVGWIDWNLCLDQNGGPNVFENYVDSPIIIDAERKEFLKQPMFYALGHISKFIPRGSVRIGSWSPPCRCSLNHVAVLTPKNTIVVVIHNAGEATSVTLKMGKNEATINIEAESIMTVEFVNE